MTGFGILQFGMSLKSHDPSQRANSMLSIVGGIIIFTKKDNKTETKDVYKLVLFGSNNITLKEGEEYSHYIEYLFE